MTIERAIWLPFWYELDQSIEVGVVDDFDFFREAPEYLGPEQRPVFYHGSWNERHLFCTARKRIVSIRHHQLGAIRKIDTRGLDYTFTMLDGRVLKVEAEESPGWVYDIPDPVDDWRVEVEMEPA